MACAYSFKSVNAPTVTPDGTRFSIDNQTNTLLVIFAQPRTLNKVIIEAADSALLELTTLDGDEEAVGPSRVSFQKLGSYVN